MARLIYSPRAFADLERLTDFLIESDSVAAGETVDLITEAVSILIRHPLIGRPVDDGIRELIIWQCNFLSVNFPRRCYRDVEIRRSS